MQGLQYVSLNGSEHIHAPQKDGDVGYDLAACDDVIINADGVSFIPFGVAIKIPDGYFGLIVGRSSTPIKHGIFIFPSVIDSGYVGPLFGCVTPIKSIPITIKKSTRIAQVILLPACVGPLVRVLALPETKRGSTGFGSSGV